MSNIVKMNAAQSNDDLMLDLMDSSEDEHKLKIDLEIDETTTEIKTNLSVNETEENCNSDQPMEAIPQETKVTDLSIISTDTGSDIEFSKKLTKKRFTSALTSAFQKIVKREKRRAFLKTLHTRLAPKTRWFKFHAFKPNDLPPNISYVPEKTLNLSSLDDKLEKCGTTVKKITSAGKVPSIPMVINEEPYTDFASHYKPRLLHTIRHPIPIVPADPQVALQVNKRIITYPKATKIPLPHVTQRDERAGMVAIPKQQMLSAISKPSSSNEPNVSQIKQHFNKSDVRPLVRSKVQIVNPKWIINKSISKPIATPNASTSGLNRVRLQKVANGSYKFISGTEKPSRESTSNFRKAIVYPYLVGKSQEVKPPMAVKYPASSTETSKSSDRTQADFKVPNSEEIHVMRPIKLLADLPREKTPEPVKYIIPQDMLFSKTDKIKEIPKELNNLEDIDLPKTLKEIELFVIENEPEEEKRPQSEATSSNKSRRKATLVPKKDDDEMMFENQEQFIIPVRPQVNIDLIDNLAKCRGLVTSLLEKLKMPQIDFTEDGDEFINMYKILRT